MLILLAITPPILMHHDNSHCSAFYARSTDLCLRMWLVSAMVCAGPTAASQVALLISHHDKARDSFLGRMLGADVSPGFLSMCSVNCHPVHIYGVSFGDASHNFLSLRAPSCPLVMTMPTPIHHLAPSCCTVVAGPSACLVIALSTNLRRILMTVA